MVLPSQTLPNGGRTLIANVTLTTPSAVAELVE
jgi:hypothetical protein